MSIDIYIGYPDTSDSLSLNQPLPFRPFSITFEISPLRTTGDTYYYKFVCSFLPNTNSKVIKDNFGTFSFIFFSTRCYYNHIIQFIFLRAGEQPVANKSQKVYLYHYMFSDWILNLKLLLICCLLVISNLRSQIRGTRTQNYYKQAASVMSTSQYLLIFQYSKI